jgi:hypothetical protein
LENLAVRIHEVFGVALSPATLADAPTVAQMTLVIAAEKAQTADLSQMDTLIESVKDIPEAELQQLATK